MNKNICCFLGHREIKETDKLKNKLTRITEDLIVNKNVDTFLFGSKSRFNDLCLEIVTQLKEKYPYIKRIYVRAEYPHISSQYEKYLLESYEETYYPQRAMNAGKAVYVERNYEMVDNSYYCIVYYDMLNVPTTRKSGTKIALDYATKKRRNIIKIE